MNRTITILSFSIVLALVIGIVSSGTIVEAVKPLEKIIIANGKTNSIPVTVDNFPRSPEVIITNSNPIPVSGISSDPVCPADKVQHWYTTIVRKSGNPSTTEIRSTTNTMILGTEYFINFKASSNDLFDVRHSVIDRLNELGYVVYYNKNNATSIPLTYDTHDLEIGYDYESVSSSHTTICANP